MTRNKSNSLYPLDPNIDRTYRRLNRGIEDNHLIFDTASSNSETDYIEIEYTETKIMVLNRERTLKDLVNLYIGYQPLCIQIPIRHEGSTSYELKSRLFNLLPIFHCLVGEDPHKYLTKFHIVCSTRPDNVPNELVKLKAFPFSFSDTSKYNFYLHSVLHSSSFFISILIPIPHFNL